MAKRNIFRPAYRGQKMEVKQALRKTKYPKEWYRLRVKFLKAHPKCAKCGAKGQNVDHVVPVSVAPERVLDWYNLQTLCWPCHKLKTRTEQPGYGRPKHLKPF